MIIPALIAAFVFLILEHSPTLCFRVVPMRRRYLVTDAAYFATGAVVVGVLGQSFVAYCLEWRAMWSGVPGVTRLGLPLWLSTVTVLVALDFGNYLTHYLLHRFAPLWAIHKTHHSSLHLDWLAAFRSHILEQGIRQLLAPAVLIVTGFPLQAITTGGIVFIAWATFIHSNLRVDLRILEPILITPRLHRKHHSAHSSGENLGTIFSFWDRLRGKLVTADVAENEPFGIGESDYPQTWLPQLLAPLRIDARTRQHS